MVATAEPPVHSQEESVKVPARMNLVTPRWRCMRAEAVAEPDQVEALVLVGTAAERLEEHRIAAEIVPQLTPEVAVEVPEEVVVAVLLEDLAALVFASCATTDRRQL